MTLGPHVVQTPVWLGPPSTFQPGSVYIRAGTVVYLDPASPLGTEYGGPSNLVAMPPGGNDSTADHACLGN